MRAVMSRLEGVVAGRVWVIFALAALIAVPTVVLGEVAASDTRQRVREAQLRTQAEAVGRIASRVTVIVSNYAEVLVAALKPKQLAEGSREAPIVAAARTGDAAAAREALQEIVTHFNYNGNVYLVDANGRIVAGLQNGNLGTHEIEIIGFSRDHLPFTDTPRSMLGGMFMTPAELAQAFAGPRVYMSDLHEPYDRSGTLMARGSSFQADRPGEWRGPRTTIAVRILVGDRLIGVLAAEMNEIPLTDAMFEIQGAAEEAYLVDRKGHLVHRLRVAPFDPELDRDLSSAPAVNTVLKGGSLRGEADDPLGRGVRLMTSARTPDVPGAAGMDLVTGWHVISAQSLDPVFASLDRDLALLRALRVSLSSHRLSPRWRAWPASLWWRRPLRRPRWSRQMRRQRGWTAVSSFRSP